jgi:ketosteroid isomerase-like protein
MKRNFLILITLILTSFSIAFGQRVKNGKIEDEVWFTVRTINRHWAITENMDSLGMYIHPDMVIISPDSKERMKGKPAIMNSYRNYAQYAQTVSLKEFDPLVQLYNHNKVSIVTYYYELEIKDQEGKVHRFTGRDMYTLVKSRNKWLAVAQQYSPIPQ